MTTSKTVPTFHVTESKGEIYLAFWPGDVGMHVSIKLPESEARRMAASLLAQADKLPRIASAADLGIAA